MATTESRQRSDADSLRDAIAQILRSWPILVLAAVVAFGASLLYSGTRDEETYQASSTLAYNTAPFGQVVVGNYTAGDPARQLATAATLATLPAVRDRVARSLGPSGVGPNTLITASGSDKANILRITATSDTPTRAAAVANATATAFLGYLSDVNGRTIAPTQRLLTEQANGAPSPSARRSLLAKRSNLASIKALLDRQFGVVGRASVPAVSSSTPQWQISAVAVLLGLLVGAGISLLRRPNPKGERL